MFRFLTDPYRDAIALLERQITTLGNLLHEERRRTAELTAIIVQGQQAGQAYAVPSRPVRDGERQPVTDADGPLPPVVEDAIFSRTAPGSEMYRAAARYARSRLAGGADPEAVAAEVLRGGADDLLDFPFDENDTPPLTEDEDV